MLLICGVRRMDGQQNNHQVNREYLVMIFLAINHYLVK